MVASNSTHKDQGAIGEFAIGEFVQGTGFTPDLNPRPPWAEPVRFKKGTRAAQQQFFAYGQAATLGENVFYDKWGYQWTDPVRKKRGLQSSLQHFYTTDVSPIPTSRGMPWFRGLDTPVRTKPGLRAQLQQTFAFDAKWIIPPDAGIQGWFRPLERPLRRKPGLSAALQAAFFYEPRLLPNPNVTMTMAATETNRDIALFALNVYNASGGTTGALSANVSIVEVPINDDGALSIAED